MNAISRVDAPDLLAASLLLIMHYLAQKALRYEALVLIVDSDREHLLGIALADYVIVEDLADLGVGMPSRDFTSDDLFSWRMMSTQNSTH